MSSQALTAHLFQRLQSDLELLKSEELLSQQDYDLLSTRLRAAQQQAELNAGVSGLAVGGGQAGGAVGGQQDQARQAPPPPPQRVQDQRTRCKAVWDYTKNQPDDLGFRTGDVITIVEEVNADWWKGELNGQTGLFPSNHVERLPSTAAPPPPPPAPAPGPAPPSAYSIGYNTPPPQQTWTPPPPPAQNGYAYSQPQGYGAPAPYGGNEKAPYSAPPPPAHYGGYSAPPPPPPLAAQPQQQQQYVVQEDQGKKSKFGKFGKQMGTAVAGGVGFGVGSSLASEAVHAIF
ncbi:hypothetical protein JCM8097_008379 [Rhodosporidiobolus ruineniae]